MRVGHSPRGADKLGASVRGSRLRTTHAVHICAYLMAPSVLAAEALWRHTYHTTRPFYVFRLVGAFHLGAHAAAHVLLLRPGRAKPNLTLTLTSAGARAALRPNPNPHQEP